MMRRYQTQSCTLIALAICLLLSVVGCRQATQNSSPAPTPTPTRPPLLSTVESEEVLRVLTMTDALDKMVRQGNVGQPFADLATKVEKEHLAAANKLPSKNPVANDLQRIISAYTVAGTLLSGQVKNSPQNPVEIVAEAYVRKTMLRRLLTGRATEKDWQAFEASNKAAGQ